MSLRSKGISSSKHEGGEGGGGYVAMGMERGRFCCYGDGEGEVMLLCGWRGEVMLLWG